MNRARAILATTALAATIIAAPAALQAPNATAHARGSIANHCITPATAYALRHVSWGSSQVHDIPCGTGMSNIDQVTFWRADFYVKYRTNTGTWRQICRQAGQWFYPYNTGGSTTAIVYPTRSC